MSEVVDRDERRREQRRAERLERVTVGALDYTPQEWAALPKILKSPTAPSAAVRRLSRLAAEG